MDERRTPEARRAPAIRRTLLPSLLTGLGLAAGWLPGSLGVLGALVAVLGLPAWGLSLLGAALVDDEGEDRLSVALAGLLCGLAVASVVLWWTALLAPLGRWRILAVMVVVSLLLRLVTGRVSPSRGPATVPGLPERSGERGPFRRRPPTVVAAVTLVFVALVLLPFLVQGTVTGDAVRKVGMTDWYKHVVVTSSLAAHEAHPVVNPFVTGEPFVYYYGFHLVAAAVHELADQQENVFGTLLLITLIVAVCSPWVLYRFARHLGLDPRPAAAVAAAGVLLAGFDVGIVVIDMVRSLLTNGIPGFDFEGLRELVPATNPSYWMHHNERSFNSPYAATIWVPQHWSAALLAVLAVGTLAERRRHRSRTRAVLVAGLSLAALPALSSYVAVAVGFALLVAGVVGLVRRPRGAAGAPDLPTWGMAALVALIASSPMLVHVAGAADRQLRVAVSAAPSAWHGGVFTALLGDSAVTRLLDTPWMLVLQLGVVGLLGVAGAGRALSGGRQVSGALQLVAPMPFAVILVAVLLRPPPGPNNFFARPMLVAWCLLVPFAVVQWQRHRRGVGWWLLVALCALCVLYGAVGATVEGYFFRPSSVARVAVAEWVRSASPEEARVAIDPREHRSDFGYWIERDFVLGDPRHAMLFGADPDAVEEIAARLRGAYDASTGAAAARAFADLGADVVLVSRRHSWEDSGCFASGVTSGEWRALFLRSVDC